jgi:hypothetical protein
MYGHFVTHFKPIEKTISVFASRCVAYAWRSTRLSLERSLINANACSQVVAGSPRAAPSRKRRFHIDFLRNFLTRMTICSLFFLLTACSHKAHLLPEPSKKVVGLIEHKTTYNMTWPLSASDKQVLIAHNTAKWLHIQLFTPFKNIQPLKAWLMHNLPSIRHIYWAQDTNLKSSHFRIIVSDYQPLPPLGPDWCPPQENHALNNLGYAKAVNLGAMIDDPYELKTTPPMGATMAPRVNAKPEVTEAPQKW